MVDLNRTQALDDAGPDPVLSDWMSRADLAGELGVTAATLCRWAARRVGPAPTRVGRKILYRRATVRAWLLEQEDRSNVTALRGGKKLGGRR